MDRNIHRASFNPVATAPDSPSHHLLELECTRILAASEPLEVDAHLQAFSHLPHLPRLLLALYSTLASKLPTAAQSEQSCQSPPCAYLKCSLLKVLGDMIERRLFVAEGEAGKVLEEASYSLFFKHSLFPFLLAVLSENTSQVSVDRLLAFFTSLHSEQLLLFPLHLYHLYGGGLFTIEAKVFKEKLTHLVESLGRVLSTAETVINRSIESFKASKERQALLEESIRTAMLSKNREDLGAAVSRISGALFGSKEYLQREEFLQLLSCKPMEPTLAIFLLLARAESLLFEERAFRSGLLARSQISSSNFYASEMTKLFNKCPFNGDERCSCKKCQCVRRNRESAKLSQEKKRNALEQLDAYRKRIDDLEQRDATREKRIGEWEQKYKKAAKRNVELEEENLMLKTLLKQMKADPNIKQLMMQTIEPVSKILNND